jgi:hypothetical protein
MAESNDSPEARAHALITRILGLVHECRAILPELEPPAAETPGAQAERHLHIALLEPLRPHRSGVLADGVVRTVEDALVMLRHARPKAARVAVVACCEACGGAMTEREGKRVCSGSVARRSVTDARSTPSTRGIRRSGGCPRRRSARSWQRADPPMFENETIQKRRARRQRERHH